MCRPAPSPRVHSGASPVVRQQWVSASFCSLLYIGFYVSVMKVINVISMIVTVR